MTETKRMTPTQLVAEWKSLAAQEKVRADENAELLFYAIEAKEDAEAWVVTLRADLDRAHYDLTSGGLRARWHRLLGRGSP